MISSASAIDTADHVIATLRAHASELCAAEFDPADRMDLFRLTALERRIAEILGQRVDLLPEPVEKPRLRVNIDRDRRLVF